MMRYLRKLLYISSVLASTSLCFGSSGADLCLVGVEGEFLYMLPSMQPNYYAVKGVDPQFIVINGKRKQNSFHYEPGFRIGVKAPLCEDVSLLHARWTRFDFGQSASVTGDNFSLGATLLTPLVGIGFDADTGIFTADSHVALHIVDGDYHQKILKCNSLDFFVSAGFQYAYVGHEREVLYFESTGTPSSVVYSDKSQFKGYGLQVGFDFMYDLGCCCQFIGKGRGALLASEYDFRSSEIPSGTTTGVPIAFSDESDWHVVPMGDIRFGFGFDSEFWCLKGHLELGYELFVYKNALLTSRLLTLPNETLSSDQFDDCSFHGFYLNLGVGF